MIPAPILAGDRLIATIRGSDAPWVPSWGDTLKDLDSDGNGRLSPDEIDKRYGRESFGLGDSNRDGIITEPEWNKLRNRGVGEFGITSVRLADKSVAWRYKRGLPYVPSPILYEGIVYSVRSGGIITALDAESGELKKEGRSSDAVGAYLASPVAADGKVYLASDEGKVVVLKAAPEWEVLAVNELGDGIQATPAIVNGAIFIRTSSKLYCFRENRKSRPTDTGGLTN